LFIAAGTQAQEAYTSHATGKQRKIERGSGPNLFFRGTHPVLDFLQPGSTSLSFHLLPIVTQAGDQAFNTWPFGEHFKLEQRTSRHRIRLLAAFQAHFFLCIIVPCDYILYI
jgi:hypothetical protein